MASKQATFKGIGWRIYGSRYEIIEFDDEGTLPEGLSPKEQRDFVRRRMIAAYEGHAQTMKRAIEYDIEQDSHWTETDDAKD